MNEVRLTPAAANTAPARASSAGSGDERTDAIEVKSTSAAVVDQAMQAKKAAIADEAVNEAVSELNQYVQNEQRDLLFSVDDGSGDMVVRVVDRSSGELIRQIPNEVVLELAAKARDNEPLQLINMHG